MTPAEREAVAALLVAVRGVLRATTGRERRARRGDLATEHDIVDALLAAPVTEPASVAELRAAIEAERDALWNYYIKESHSMRERLDAARDHVDTILFRLDVTGPVVRCAACPIQARAGEPCAHDVEDCAAYGGPTVTGPAQRGEADEESTAREAIIAALARARGALYSVQFGTSTAAELDAAIDATSWEAIRAKKGAGL